MATPWSLRACTHSSMVLTPTIGQSLGLAGVASGSGIGSTFDLLPHVDSSRIGLTIGELIKGEP